MMNNFGFLIWGISNIDGFKENILSSNEALSNEEVKNYPKDYIRQLCGRARFGGCFYAIEVASNYTFVSIINPETKETGTASERGAYIVISLFLKNGNVFKGEVLKTLDKLMDYYLKQQSDSAEINFTDTMFEEQFSNLSSVNYHGNSFKIESKVGYKIYSSKDEIESNFKYLNIEGYKRVFFFDKSNLKLDEIINSDFIKGKYESVSEFTKRFEPVAAPARSNGMGIESNKEKIVNTNSNTINVKGGPKNQVGLILGIISALIIVGIISYVVYRTSKPEIGTVVDKKDTTKIAPPIASDSKLGITNDSAESVITTPIAVLDVIPLKKEAKADKKRGDVDAAAIKKDVKPTELTIDNCPVCISFSKRISNCRTDEPCKKDVRKEEAKHRKEVKHGK